MTEEHKDSLQLFRKRVTFLRVTCFVAASDVPEEEPHTRISPGWGAPLQLYALWKHAEKRIAQPG